MSVKLFNAKQKMEGTIYFEKKNEETFCNNQIVNSRKDKEVSHIL